MTDRQVVRYAKLTRLIKRLEEERDKLRESAVADLQAGVACPKSTPYLLKLVVQHRRRFQWREWAEKLAKRFKAEQLLATMMEGAEDFEVAALQVVPNPDWGK